MKDKNKQKYDLMSWIDEINQNQKGMYGSAQKVNNEKMKQLIYHNVYNRLMNILLKMYKWDLPETLNTRAIEMGLINRGQLCVFKDNSLGVYALPCIPQSLYNIYGDPTQVQVFGYNGWQKLVNVEYQKPIPTNLQQYETSAADATGVYCRDNDMTYPYINYVEEYAGKIADKLMALDIAAQKLKSPFRFAIGDMDLKDTVDTMIEKIQSNDDAVILVKSNKIDGHKINEVIQPFEQVINPANIDALKNAIVFDYNMFLETIGLNTNPSPDKSQVVLTPELESNNSVIDIENDVRFLNRQKLCEDCKNILGVDMKVEKNIDEAKQEANKYGKELMKNGNDSNKQEQE